jgi:hypothetical protein
MAVIDTEPQCQRRVRQDAVIAAINIYFPEHDCFVSPCTNSWITVLDKDCEIGLTPLIVETAGTIARVCACPGIVLGLLHSDYFYYWAFDRTGNLITFSYPHDVETASEEETSGLGGNPGCLVPFCRPGVTETDIRSALSQQHASKYPNFCALADLLGIDRGNAALSHRYITKNSGQWYQAHIESWRAFVHLRRNQIK